MAHFTIDDDGHTIVCPGITSTSAPVPLSISSARRIKSEIAKQRGTISDHIKLGQWAAAARHARQLADQCEVAAKLKLPPG